MKRIIAVGKPTHFQSGDRRITARGLVGTHMATRNAHSVDCLRCRKTWAFKEAVDGRPEQIEAELSFSQTP